MKFKSRYEAKQPDVQGMVHYTAEEDHVWNILYERQVKLLSGRACDEYIQGIRDLEFTAHEIPQIPQVNAHLRALTGWQVAPVAALISSEEFFSLLANKHFPVATFIRAMAELDYVTEPDIFHELFGHCPMFANQTYADFVQAYAQLALDYGSAYWPLMLRLFWFTVEFGLIKTSAGLRAYGGGILSSAEETVYCIESSTPQRKVFDAVEVFRTPYRIDRLQCIYYVINDYQQLYDMMQFEIRDFIEQARQLGEFSPQFPVEKDNPCIYIGAFG
ncbi:MAG: phenylalanine 4-monooxygenase [Gammaproteobacteria bacterium]